MKLSTTTVLLGAAVVGAGAWWWMARQRTAALAPAPAAVPQGPAYTSDPWANVALGALDTIGSIWGNGKQPYASGSKTLR